MSLTLEARVQALVNRSVKEMQTVRWSAKAVAERGFEPASLVRLREIQRQLENAMPNVVGQMRWLVLVMVQNNPDCHEDLRGMMNALPVALADFSVYHYDSRTAPSRTEPLRRIPPLLTSTTPNTSTQRQP